jgi:hypothetical protein
MTVYSDRRMKQQSAKIDPRHGVGAGGFPDGVAPLVRATSPPHVSLLAGKPPAPIKKARTSAIWLHMLDAMTSRDIGIIQRFAKAGKSDDGFKTGR